MTLSDLAKYSMTQRKHRASSLRQLSFMPVRIHTRKLNFVFAAEAESDEDGS